MRVLAALTAILLASPAIAEDYRIKVTEIAKGSSVTFLMGNGGRQTHHFEGPVSGGYEVTFWNGHGKGTGGGIEGRLIYNADGRALSFARTGGKVIKFEPHNCFRVVGLCTYTERRSDGRTRKLGRRLEPDGNGFAFEYFQIYGEIEKLLAKGRTNIDAMGMIENLTIEEASVKSVVSMTQESADYR